MTREEAYNDGWHDGRLWAEQDIRDGWRIEPDFLATGSDTIRAWNLGAMRGYRDTWARFDAGEITTASFELMPLSTKDRGLR